MSAAVTVLDVRVRRCQLDDELEDGLPEPARRVDHAERRACRVMAQHAHDVHVNLQQNGDKPFVRHFRTKYTGSAHLPIWMAVELMSFGNVTSMYQGCTDDVRDLVASHVGGVSNAIFGSWLLTLGRRRVPGRQDVQALARTVEVGIRCVALFRARSARSASGATAGATSLVVWSSMASGTRVTAARHRRLAAALGGQLQ
jgi:hypothetical protein